MFTVAAFRRAARSGALLCASVALLCCGRTKPPEPPEPFPPWQLPESAGRAPSADLPESPEDLSELDASGNRCSEKLRTVLPVLSDSGGPGPVYEIDVLLGSPLRVTVPFGRHGGQNAVPLPAAAGAVAEGGAVAVYPCRGDPLLFSARMLNRQPTRWLLVKSGKGTLKLIDMEADPNRPVTKNLAALVVRDP